MSSVNKKQVVNKGQILMTRDSKVVTDPRLSIPPYQGVKLEPTLHGISASMLG